MMSEYPHPNQPPHLAQSSMSPLPYSQSVHPPQHQPVPYLVQPPPYLIQPVYVQPPRPLTWWRLMPWWAKAFFVLGMLTLAGFMIFACAGLLDGWRFLT
jgi:hypothetical protein